MIHLFLHFLIPLVISKVFTGKLGSSLPEYNIFNLPAWLTNWLLMMLTMFIDIDHIIATPIYQPERCSIGFHPLHTFLPITFYIVLCFPKKTRIVGVGLVIHMLLDSIDCYANSGVWFV